jgi:hypothetical protein
MTWVELANISLSNGQNVLWANLNYVVPLSYLVGRVYGACTTETCLRVLMGEGIATARKNYYRYSDRRPIGAQVKVACLKRIPWGAATTTVPQPPALCCPT